MAAMALIQQMPDAYEMLNYLPDGRTITVFHRQNGEGQLAASDMNNTLWEVQYFYTDVGAACAAATLWAREGGAEPLAYIRKASNENAPVADIGSEYYSH